MAMPGRFDARNVPGLQLWLHAERVGYPYADGVGVGNWIDLSGQGNHATQPDGSSGVRPLLKTGAIGGRRSVRWDGADDFLGSALSAALKPVTIIAVLWPSGQTAGGTIVGGTGAAGGLQFRIDDPAGTLSFVKQDVVGIGTSSGSVPLAAPSIVVGTYDASGNYAFYINGAASGTGLNNQTLVANTTTIGRFWNSNTEILLGDLGALLVFSRVLVDAERKYVERGLANQFSVKL